MIYVIYISVNTFKCSRSNGKLSGHLVGMDHLHRPLMFARPYVGKYTGDEASAAFIWKTDTIETRRTVIIMDNPSLGRQLLYGSKAIRRAHRPHYKSCRFHRLYAERSRDTAANASWPASLIPIYTPRLTAPDTTTAAPRPVMTAS